LDENREFASALDSTHCRQCHPKIHGETAVVAFAQTRYDVVPDWESQGSLQRTTVPKWDSAPVTPTQLSQTSISI